MEERISCIYAAIETGEIDTAETLFFKAWKTSRDEMRNQVSSQILNRFMELLLEKALLEFRIQGYLSSGYDMRALEWFDSMSTEYGCQPTIRTFSTLLSFYLETMNYTKCKDLVEQLEAMQLRVDDLFLDVHFSEERHYKPLEQFLASIGKKTERQLVDLGDLLQNALEESQNPPVPSADAKSSNDLLFELTPTSTIGVGILRNTLKAKEKIAKMDKYNQQLWLESRARTAAEEQFVAMQEKMPKELRKLSHVPHDLIESWHRELQAEIEQTIADPADVDERKLVPFLRLVSSDVICRIVITNLLQLPSVSRRGDQKESLTKFGQFLAVELAQTLGKTLEKEHNFEQLHSKRNQKILNLQKSIHKVHSSGKLFNIAIRKAMVQLTREETKRIENWRPEWGVIVVASIGSYLLNKATKVCKLPVRVPTDVENEFRDEIVPAFEHGQEWRDGKRYGVIRVHSALFDMISNSSHLIAPWSLPML
ncbi:DNA-directed RNA polymerase, partial [Kappamyces sp. JEL0680]